MATAPGAQSLTTHGNWLIANVLAQISFGLLAMTLCLPSMQEWGAIFDTSQADVQLTFSGYVLAYGALQLVYGPLSDRHGRKPILMLGLVMMLALGLGGVQTALAVALPLVLLGLGHGLINPPALAGTVSVLPALAGSAAAVAGLMQQLTGATGGYLVGLVPHHGAVNLGWMMLAFALSGATAQFFLRRR